MPLVENVTELNRSNCVRVMLNSFQGQPGEIAGAGFSCQGRTDEFYFFRRAHAN